MWTSARDRSRLVAAVVFWGVIAEPIHHHYF
jgi:hypothetical protein